MFCICFSINLCTSLPWYLPIVYLNYITDLCCSVTRVWAEIFAEPTVHASAGVEWQRLLTRQLQRIIQCIICAVRFLIAGSWNEKTAYYKGQKHIRYIRHQRHVEPEGHNSAKSINPFISCNSHREPEANPRGRAQGNGHRRQSANQSQCTITHTHAFTDYGHI